MSDYLDFDIRVDAAVHVANTELRERKHGDFDAADRAHDRLVDLVEYSDFPRVTLAAIVRRLGRHRSLDVGIELPAVNAALRS